MKHSLELKLAVVMHYTEGHGGQGETAAYFNVEITSVKKWIRAYLKHGLEGLKRKRAHTPYEEKLKIVLTTINEELSPREAAARFNVSDASVIRKWVSLYKDYGAESLNSRRGMPGTVSNKTPSDRKETARPPEQMTQEELADELSYLRAENAYLKKLEALGSKQKAKEKTQIINELRHDHGLRDLLRAAKLPRSTWYHNLKRLTLPDPYADLKSQICEIYQYHKGRYGYRRITVWLRRQGLRINHKVVQKLMEEMELKALIRVKKYRSWKGDVGKVAPNLLQRNFDAEKANEKWVTDVTEFAVDGKKLYLSPVLDLYNREIIAYSMSERPRMQMINSMLDQAMSRLGERDKPVLHSDQGWQYQMKHYQNVLQSNGVVQSMSRKGNCLDNAVMEGFFGMLKSECYYLNKFKSTKELRRAIEEYIDYYNHERISSRLKGLSPVEYRTQVHLAA
ncbi:IS3 family transposase [Enterobacter mori]|uniref:IS3 family transposase n=1 Tax=Enterobacter mori TaxID=539813 RepID=UPI003B83E599